MGRRDDQTGAKPPFTSVRERRLWTWTALVVVTIYTTLGLAGSLAGRIGESGLNAITFVAGSLLVAGAAVSLGVKARPGDKEVFVAIGVVAVYTLVFTRLTSPVERSHLIEYGVVALLIHAALVERARNGGRVPAPALMAIAATAFLGLVDELIQWFLPTRVFDPVDVGFNALAAGMAVATAVVLAGLRHRRSIG